MGLGTKNRQKLTPAHLQTASPAILTAAGVEAVILDTYQFYVEVIPMILSMPYVHVLARFGFCNRHHSLPRWRVGRKAIEDRKAQS